MTLKRLKNREDIVGPNHDNGTVVLADQKSERETQGSLAAPVEDTQSPDLRGRPVYTVCHSLARESLFSHLNRGINLQGFLNLLVIMSSLFTGLLTYGKGVRTRLLPPSSINDLLTNWPILVSLIWMHINFFFAFFLEKCVFPLMHPQSSKIWKINSLAMILGNAFMILWIPYYTLTVYDVDPVCGTLLIGFSITWFLKLFSFHHVLFDLRYALLKKETLTYIGGLQDAYRYSEFLKLTDYYAYLVMPTLCYQFHYPRTHRIRWTVVLSHSTQILICLVLIKIVIEQYMVVILQNTFVSPDTLNSMSVVRIFFYLSERILKLSVPNLCVWLLMFFIVFHHWLNILAEVTYFADRQFYGDWWNSSSFEEYWRKWNCPIHNFLHRHVHKPLLSKGVTRLMAGQVVFILSAFAHEYMVVVPLRLGWTGLVFTAFIAQIPLIYITSKPKFKEYPTLGNALFWVLFCFTGQPLAILFYYYLWGVQHGKLRMNPQGIPDMCYT